MSDKKGWASTVAGWFIERDEPTVPAETDLGEIPDQPLPTVPDNYTTPSPTQSVFQQSPPPPTGGQVDFAAVFAAAGVDQEEQQPHGEIGQDEHQRRTVPAGQPG